MSLLNSFTLLDWSSQTSFSLLLAIHMNSDLIFGGLPTGCLAVAIHQQLVPSTNHCKAFMTSPSLPCCPFSVSPVSSVAWVAGALVGLSLSLSLFPFSCFVFFTRSRDSVSLSASSGTMACSTNRRQYRATTSCEKIKAT